MRRAACCLALAACRFTGPDGVTPDGPPGAEPAPPSGWWDPTYPHRRRLSVTAGDVRPDHGYAGYTVRLGPFDPVTAPTALTGLTSRCDDLRVVAFDGVDWTERPRHVLGCGTAELDLRFALPVDLTDGATWQDAYVYYGRADAEAPAPATGTAVYRWWDDAAANRSTDYVHGRMDAWLGTGHRDSFAWNAGAYTFDTGDDAQESLRRTVDERDVLVEAEWLHTGCYNNNMQTSVCDPPPIVANQWRKQALAVFGAGPTHLRFWDADASWPGLATPPDAAIQARGDDATAEYTQRGAAGAMIVQDIGRLRNLVIRRYVEPEPVVELLDEESAP